MSSSAGWGVEDMCVLCKKTPSSRRVLYKGFFIFCRAHAGYVRIYIPKMPFRKQTSVIKIDGPESSRIYVFWRRKMPFVGRICLSVMTPKRTENVLKFVT